MRLSACSAALAVLILVSCGGTAAPASSSAPSALPAKPSAAVSAASSAPAAAAAASAGPASGSPASSGGTKVTIGFATNSGETSPVWVAADLGMYKSSGLDVTLTQTQGTLGADALVSGTIQAGFMGGADAMTAIAAGTPLKVLFVLVKENPYAIVARPEIKTPDDLKGKSLAIGKLGDTSDVSAHIALSRFGLVPGKDVTERQVGNSPARYAAMQSGQVAAAVEDEAYTAMLVKQGMHELVSLAKENVPYITNSLVVNTNYAQAQPRIVEAMVRGTNDGLKYTLDPSHRQQVVAEIAKWERSDPNSPEMDTVYESLLTSLAKDPTPEVAGAETILKALQSMDPNRFGKLTAAQAIDPSIIQRVLSASPSAAAKSA